MPIYKQNIDESKRVQGKEYKDYFGNLQKQAQSKYQNTNDSKTNKSDNLYESLLSSITRSMILEFDANGDEKNIPGADDDNSDYSFDDAEDDDSNTNTTTADSGDNNNNVEDQQNSPEDQNDDTESDEYSFGDDESHTQDTNDDSQENAEDNDTAEQDDSSNEDEYNLDDGEDNSDNNDDTSNNTGEQQNNSSDDAGSDDYDFDSNDDNSSGSDLDGEDGNNEDDAQSGLKKIEGELFENLSPKQKEIKIKALKQNFLDLYDRCGDVIDLISDNTPASEEESRIFDFVSKTVTELQSNVHDYLADTFGTKTYIDNDAQFKQYLIILDSVKKILDEFLDVKTDKKEETGKK